MASEKKTQKTTSFLSENIELKGNLKLEGGIRIDGHFSGNIQAGNVVYLGESARVEGSLVAEGLISSGVLIGEVRARETVKINHPGSLKAQVEAAALVLDENVFFQGQCRLIEPEQQSKPKLAKPRFPRIAIPNREENKK